MSVYLETITECTADVGKQSNPKTGSKYRHWDFKIMVFLQPNCHGLISENLAPEIQTLKMDNGNIQYTLIYSLTQ